MSHQRVDSQGSIAFSWEDSPGISKHFMHQKLFSSSSYNNHFNGELKLPPPPAPFISRTSMKASRKNDPFVAAFIECTKNVGNNRMATTVDYEKRKNNGYLSKGKKSSTYLWIFSCKQSSCDVKVGNLVKLNNLPPIPRPRGTYRALINEDED